MPRLTSVLAAKFNAPVTVVALLAELKPVYVKPLAPVPAFAPVSAKLVVPVMSPPAPATELNPEYVSVVAAEVLLVSSKFAATLVIAPVPVTVPVTLANVIPSLLFAPSLKPAAPVTVVVSAAVKPL